MEKTGRYLVVIEGNGRRTGRVFDADHELLAEFDAASQEVARLTDEVQPQPAASGTEWDRALHAYDGRERRAAQVYDLA